MLFLLVLLVIPLMDDYMEEHDLTPVNDVWTIGLLLWLWRMFGYITVNLISQDYERQSLLSSWQTGHSQTDEI